MGLQQILEQSQSRSRIESDLDALFGGHDLAMIDEEYLDIFEKDILPYLLE